MTAPLPVAPKLRLPAPTLWLRSPDGALQAAVVYREVAYVEKNNDLGKWTASLPYTPQTLWAAEPDWEVLLVEQDGTVALSGPILKPTVTEPAGRTPGSVALEGVDDLDVLDRSLAWPSPSQPIGNQVAAYDSRTGVASTILQGYWADNIGQSAQAARRNSRVVIETDAVVGATVSEQARFDNLLILSQSVANKGGIQFRARTNIDGFTRLSCRAPRTMPDVKFSTALGNATDVQWSREGGVSDMIGGGQGDLDQRAFVISTDPAVTAAYGRREDFYDYRNADPAQLQTDTDAKRAEKAPTRQASFTPLDTPTVRFGRHYRLGDTVTFETVTATGAQSWLVPIQEVEKTWSRGGGRTVKPRAGDLGATATTRRRLTEKELLRRVSRLESGA